nr:MAG TPA: hypothetical protein [Caudoviricetes sp.]
MNEKAMGYIIFFAVLAITMLLTIFGRISSFRDR